MRSIYSIIFTRKTSFRHLQDENGQRNVNINAAPEHQGIKYPQTDLRAILINQDLRKKNKDEDYQNIHWISIIPFKILDKSVKSLQIVFWDIRSQTKKFSVMPNLYKLFSGISDLRQKCFLLCQISTNGFLEYQILDKNVFYYAKYLQIVFWNIRSQTKVFSIMPNIYKLFSITAFSPYVSIFQVVYLNFSHLFL